MESKDLIIERCGAFWRAPDGRLFVWAEGFFSDREHTSTFEIAERLSEDRVVIRRTDERFDRL